jgi:hypothetical protein
MSMLAAAAWGSNAKSISTSWRCAAWFLERQNPDVFGRRGPNTVTLADLHGIFGAMMKLLLEGVAEPAARQRLMKNFDGFFQRLGGQQRSSPRVRRAIMELELQQTQCVAATTEAPEGSTHSQDGCATNGENCSAPNISESVKTASENPENRATE